ncbi:MAG TPA: helix-turn-helix domain-containing protein [Acidobacteriaceae bacterium]
MRKEREARGVALEAITKTTKISNRHLVALEQEQFQTLPGGVFNKGIVRGYARAIGLNEEEWVERYLSAYQASGKAPDDETGWMQFAENALKARQTSIGRRPDMRLRWAGVVLLLLLLTILSWFVWNYVHKRIAANGHPRAASQMMPAFHVRPLPIPSDTLEEMQRT